MANTKVSPVYGVNENGEIVAAAGTGSGNITGFLSPNELPVDANGKLVIAGLGGGGGGADLQISGTQAVGSKLTADYTKGTGTVRFTRTPVAGGAATEITGDMTTPAQYTLVPADRGFVISAKAMTYVPAPATGVAIPTVAPLAPTVNTPVVASNTSVSVAVTRNADNGGDTVVNDQVYIYNTSDQQIGTNSGSGNITVGGLPSGATVYARAATRGATNGLGPLSAKSIAIAIALAAAGRNNGNMRLFGNQAQIAIPSPQTSATTGYVYKIQAPAGAIGARVSVHNRSATLGAAYIKAQMAVTDVGAIDTNVNAFSAQVGGTINNSAYNATTNLYGFRKATWKGAAQSRRIYPANAVPPSLGYMNQEDTVTSDYIALPSTPIRAKDRNAEEYYYILRLTVGAVPNQDGLAGIYPVQLNAYAAEWTATQGADCSLLFANGTGTADSGDTSFSIPGAASQGQSPSVSIEWTYPPNIQPVTFWHVGDSITESYKWNRWAVQRRNTNPQRPLHVVNVGGSTTRTKDYLGNMYLLLQTMAKPDYVVLPITSINNYTPTSGFFNLANAQAEYQRLVDTYNNLNALGIKMIWWAPMNYAILTANYSPGIGAAGKPTPGDYSNSWSFLYNKCKEFATANGITFMDFAHDSRIVWVSGQKYNVPAGSNMTSWNGDDTHPSDPVGMTGFATIYSEALTGLGF